MRCAQLDQNLSSKKLIDACNREGGVTVLPLPDALKGKLDDVLLHELLPTGRLIVTNDLGLVAENPEWLPTIHPGVLIVDQDDDAPATMTWKIALRILSLRRSVASRGCSLLRPDSWSTFRRSRFFSSQRSTIGCGLRSVSETRI